MQAFVFQAPIILRRTVAENLAYPLKIRGESSSNAQKLAAEWAEKIELGSSTRLNAGFLSGGEKQKLAIARALIIKPEVLFLDEPTTNLDGRSIREIETLLTQARTDGTRIVMATHDIGQARRLASDVIFLYRGQLVEHSKAERYFSEDATPQAKAYLNGDILE